MKDGLKLRVYPATPSRWSHVEKLFGARGACAGCWCQWWKGTRKEWEAGKGAGNRRRLKASVEQGEKPGLIAYQGKEPVGWCAVEQRDRYPGLERARLLKPIDDKPVWSISCFFVRREFRRQGVSRFLIEAAKAHMVRHRGSTLEAYPTDLSKDSPDAFVWHGVASAFVQAGFEECARRSPTRPILRWSAPSGHRDST